MNHIGKRSALFFEGVLIFYVFLPPLRFNQLKINCSEVKDKYKKMKPLIHGKQICLESSSKYSAWYTAQKNFKCMKEYKNLCK